MIFDIIVGEAQPAEEVATQSCEEDDPQAEEYFAVQNMPAVSLIGHGEELQGESNLDKT